MRAAETQGVGRPLAIVEVDDPTPGPDDVVVEVTDCGICGSDLHISEHLDMSGIVLGHEVAGRVVATGTESAARWAEGDAVAILPTVGCAACGHCLRGEPSRCAVMQLAGLHRPGGFAEYMGVPERQLFRLPEGLGVPGGITEPLAVALHAVRKSGPVEGEAVLVLGGGPVGAAVTLVARALGAGPVVVSDPVEQRRHIAEKVGAAATVDPSTEHVASAFEQAAGRAPRIVIECVGVPGLIQHAVEVADFDARITVVGVCMTEDTFTPLAALHKEVAMQFVLYYTREDFADTITMLGDGRLDPSPLVTAEIGLDELPERFESLRTPTHDCKVVVRP